LGCASTCLGILVQETRESVGADVVEVLPQFDLSGATALLGANLAYEMLCVLPGVARR